MQDAAHLTRKLVHGSNYTPTMLRRCAIECSLPLVGGNELDVSTVAVVIARQETADAQLRPPRVVSSLS